MDSITQQVTQIMAKAADPGTTDAEREMLVKRAQTLSTRHGLDAAVLRQKLEQSQRRETPTFKVIYLAKRGTANKAVWCELFMAIGEAQDLQFTIAHNSTYVTAYGFPSDIEVTEALYGSLAIQMTEESTAYLRSGEYKKHPEYVRVKKREPNPDYGQRDWWTGKAEPKYLYEWVMELKPPSGVTARRDFNKAFISKVRSRLRAAKAEAVAHFQQKVDETVDALAPVLVSEAAPMDGAMVLVKKRQEVSDYYGSKTSHIKGSWRGDSTSYHQSTHARGAGREAGARARIGGSAPAITSGGRAIRA